MIEIVGNAVALKIRMWMIGEEVESIESVSLYVHIPFCAHKCGYCHFYVVPDQEESKIALLEALEKEWDQILPKLKSKRCVSIYFGGGTPSLFGPHRVGTLLRRIRKECLVLQEAEITLEVNPEDASEELFAAYAEVGINRISIGVQSFDDALLRTLTRKHSAQDCQQAVYNAARAGIRKISIDLMYDLPGQTLSAWRNTLQTALTLPISHLSLYNLTIEPHTSFDRKRALLEEKRPCPSESRAMYEEAISSMEAKGWVHYEISAFGRQGEVSLHNVGYWQGRPFLGLGPSAYSYWQGARFRNVAHLKQYCKAMKEGRSAIDFSETLSLEASHREHLIIRLRTTEGIEMASFQREYGTFSAEALSLFRRFEEQGWLKEGEGRIYLTREGKLFYDSIAVELV